MLAWLFARSSGSRFVMRMEDLDRVRSSADHEARQLLDLAALGVDHDGAVVRQSDRFDLYDAAIEDLTAAGLTYPCYCTRREIREAAERWRRKARGCGRDPWFQDLARLRRG